GDFGAVAHLAGQVAGDEIAAVCQSVLGARDAFDLGLPTQAAIGADFAGDARHFGGERAKLIHHRVDGVFQFQNFAFDIDGDLLQIGRASCSDSEYGYVVELHGQVAGHR